MIADYIDMEDDLTNETMIGGDVSWEEQEDGTFSQIVVLHFRNRGDLVNIIVTGVTKKELFEVKLKGEDNWPLTETILKHATHY